jgi:hypothetical protein
MNKIEYLILYAALEESESLKNVASDWKLPHVEVAVAAKRLFQNGDILAEFPNNQEESIKGIVLTMPQICAHLNGKLKIFYYLTPQGGAKWETISKANWNKYYTGHFGKYDIETGLHDGAEGISPSRELIQNRLKVDEYLNKQIHIPETVIWSEVEPWQATYWKILPFAYKINYKYLNQNNKRAIELNNTHKCELDKQIKKMFAEVQQWYTEPLFEETPPNSTDYEEFNYHTSLDRVELQKIEYLILEFAVIFQDYSLENFAYSKDFSHAETAIAADSLFQKGYIRAKVFADEYDFEGTPDVLLTIEGIQDHLNGRIRASYYLTFQGGTYWERIAHPDWDKFFIVNFSAMFPYDDGIFATQREIIEQLLALDRFILICQHIPGTEVWEVIEPWQATYWKTLPRGFHLIYEYEDNEQDYWSLDDNSPAELKESYDRAAQWYDKARKWYTNPFNDNIDYNI